MLQSQLEEHQLQDGKTLRKAITILSMESLGTKGPIRMPDGTFFLEQSHDKKKSPPGLCYGGHDDV